MAAASPNGQVPGRCRGVRPYFSPSPVVFAKAVETAGDAGNDPSRPASVVPMARLPAYDADQHLGVCVCLGGLALAVSRPAQRSNRPESETVSQCDRIYINERARG